MKKHEYEAPKFVFQELQLIERVADRCWGAGKVLIDTDNNGTYDEVIYLSGKGCSHWEEIYETKMGYKPDPNLVNVKEQGYLPIYS